MSQPDDITEEQPWMPTADVDGLAPSSADTWQKWKAAPSPHTMSAVLATVKPVIESAAGRFPGLNSDLMQSEGRRLAIQAVQSFDPTAGTSLNTHVFNHLRPLSRFAQKTRRAISIPRERGQEVSGFVKFNRDFLEENGREPSDHELMDGLGVSAKKLQSLRNGEFYEFAEGQTENSLEVDPGESRLARWTDLVYHDLPDRDRLIMDYRLGRNGREVLEPEAIAVKMGLDASYIRKRTTAISQRILEGVK
jgi:DNA-directed RNA polymerase specialized sigma subunit